MADCMLRIQVLQQLKATKHLNSIRVRKDNYSILYGYRSTYLEEEKTKRLQLEKNPAIPGIHLESDGNTMGNSIKIDPRPMRKGITVRRSSYINIIPFR